MTLEEAIRELEKKRDELAFEHAQFGRVREELQAQNDLLAARLQTIEANATTSQLHWMRLEDGIKAVVFRYEETNTPAKTIIAELNVLIAPP